MFCNHDAVKVFVCLRSVLSLFLLDHLHQVDNYDDRTVFPLIIKRVIVPCLLKHVDGSATGKNSQFRVPTRPGKPGKMRVHLENLEISWNFVKFNKYHGKMTCNLEKLGGY